MAVVLGTNSGFVTTAPTADPAGAATSNVDDRAHAVEDTTDSGSYTVTEIGWYCVEATEESNFEVGIYADDSGSPGELLFSDTTNAKGTDAGWKTVTGLNWNLDGNTTYWIAVQMDDTATTSSGYLTAAGKAETVARKNTGETTLSDPWGSSDTTFDRWMAIYALVEPVSAGAGAMNMLGLIDEI